MPGFRSRLTRTQQRVYDRSDAVTSIPIRPSARLCAAISFLPDVLPGGNAAQVERLSQCVADEIAAALRVASVRIVVNGTRPSNARGELHGLYTPAHGTRAAVIKVWMITAKRGQVVAFKTYLRTLLHEICHHLDYTLLRLPDSFHTSGFYRRESSMFHQIGGSAADRSAAGGTGPRPAGAARQALLR